MQAPLTLSAGLPRRASQPHEREGLLVERLELHTSDPTAGSAAIRLVLSNYNSVAAILPPAAGQFDPSGVQPAAS